MKETSGTPEIRRSVSLWPRAFDSRNVESVLPPMICTICEIREIREIRPAMHSTSDQYLSICASVKSVKSVPSVLPCTALQTDAVICTIREIREICPIHLAMQSTDDL